MQRKDLPLVGVWLLMLILVFVIPFVFLADIPRFSGGFLFYIILFIAQLVFVAVYITKSWKGVLK